MGYFIEESRLHTAGKNMAIDFGLSEERGMAVAKLAYQWKELQQQRALTDEDANAFSKELLGFDLKDAQKAYEKSQNGDNSELEDLIEGAAQTNQTTKERMKELFLRFSK